MKFWITNCVALLIMSCSVFAAPGDNCIDPITITMPYTETAGSNCGSLDDYDETCLEFYDGGEDIFYEFTLTSDSGVTVTLDPKITQYAGFLIDDACPPDSESCIFTINNNSAVTPMTSGHIDLPAGTYYVMIDTFPQPDCIPDYDLTIVESIAPTPTPTTVPSSAGDNCGWTINVDQIDLPFTDTAQTTCSRGNDYETTCLGYYDGGEDIVYQLNLTSATGINITLDPGSTGWTGMVLDDSCPPDADDCIMTTHSVPSDPYSTDCFDLDAGTYYIMVDIYPPPDDCIPAFDLLIEECSVPTPTPTNTPMDCSGALPEGEIDCYDEYDDVTNIGCNTGTMWSIFTEIGCGESICGTAGNFMYDGDVAKDTDWFEFEVPIQTDVHLTLESSFDADFFVGDYNDCFNQIELGYAHVLPGTPDTLTVNNLSPGIYHAFIAPHSFTGTACGSQYRLDLDCDNVTPTPIPPTPTPFPFCDTGQIYQHTTGGPIPDNGCGTTSLEAVIPVAETFAVTDVTVRLSINHPFDADLEAFLHSPDGTIVELFSDVGGGLDNFAGTVFTDESAIPINLGTAPFPYAYHPEGNLSDFIGVSSAGDWTLEVCDDASGDLGNLVEWELCLEGDIPAPIPSTSVWGLLLLLMVLGGALKFWQAKSIN